MGLSEIKLPNDSNAGGYANKKFVQSMLSEMEGTKV